MLINILHYNDARQREHLFQWLTDWSSTACLPYHLTSATYRNRVEVSYRRLEPAVRRVHRPSDTFETSVRNVRGSNSIDLTKYFNPSRRLRSVFIAAAGLPRHVASPRTRKKDTLYWLFVKLINRESNRSSASIFKCWRACILTGKVNERRRLPE